MTVIPFFHENKVFLQAFDVGMRCGLAALVFGSVGMWIGETLSPLEINPLTDNALTKVIISSMSLFMIVICLPVCLLACPTNCRMIYLGDKALLHALGKAGMLLGMTAGFQAFPTVLIMCGSEPYFVAHASMIVGMTLGASAGYALAFLILSIGNEQPEQSDHQSCCEGIRRYKWLT